MLRQLRTLAHDSIVYGLSGIATRFLNFLLVPLYTRVFPPEDYGIISLITASMTVVSIFTVLALDTAAGRWFWDTEDVFDRKSTMASWAWCQLTVASLFAVAIYALADRLGPVITGHPGVGVYFRLAAAALPLGVLGWVTTNWLRFQRRPWVAVGYALGTSLASILTTIILVVFLRRGLVGIYLAQVVAGVVSTAGAVVLMRDWVSPSHFSWPRLLAMLRFALPLIPSALAFWVVSFADRYFVQFYTSTSEVGLYQVGSSIAAAVAVVTAAFQQAWGPFAMSIHKQEDAKPVYANVLLAYLWTTCLLGSALSILAPEAIRVIATDRYLGAETVVGLLAFSYIMNGLVYIAAIGPTIAKSSAPIGMAAILAAGLNIVFNFLLTPRFGKTGSALAAFLSQSAMPIYLFYRAQRIYPIPYRFKTAIMILALSFLVIGVAAFCSSNHLWFSLVVRFTLVSLFVPALFLLRLVTPAQARALVHLAVVAVLQRGRASIQSPRGD